MQGFPETLQMADPPPKEAILKRPFFRSDTKLGNFRISAIELASSGQEVICGAHSLTEPPGHQDDLP
jgi:hypothetical protein